MSTAGNPWVRISLVVSAGILARSEAYAHGADAYPTVLGVIFLISGVVTLAIVSAIEAVAYQCEARLAYLRATGITFVANLAACAVMLGALRAAYQAPQPSFVWTLLACVLGLIVKVTVILVTNRHVGNRRALFVPALSVNGVFCFFLLGWLEWSESMPDD